MSYVYKYDAKTKLHRRIFHIVARYGSASACRTKGIHQINKFEEEWWPEISLKKIIVDIFWKLYLPFSLFEQIGKHGTEIISWERDKLKQQNRKKIVYCV